MVMSSKARRSCRVPRQRRAQDLVAGTIVVKADVGRHRVSPESVELIG